MTKNKMKKKYIKPTSEVVHLSGQDIMETLPIGGSGDYTDSGDDSGGGLAKKGINFTKVGDHSVWDDDEEQ